MVPSVRGAFPFHYSVKNKYTEKKIRETFLISEAGCKVIHEKGGEGELLSTVIDDVT